METLSQRETEKKYNKLMKSVQEDEFFKTDLTNRVNCYRCQCGHITKTKDIDPGVTPMMFNCEKCQKTASSTFYTDIAPEQKPTIEWYRPSLKEVLKLRNRPHFLDHIFNGGLLSRPIKQQNEKLT